MSTPDPTPLGLPYAIGEVVLEVMRTDPALAHAAVSDNPSTPADIQDGDRVLIFKDLDDTLADQNGQAQNRTYTFQAGSMARTTSARLDAHSDYRALKRALRAALSQFVASDVRVRSQLKNGNVSFNYDDDGISGALVLGTFSIDYRDID